MCGATVSKMEIVRQDAEYISGFDREIEKYLKGGEVN